MNLHYYIIIIIIILGQKEKCTFKANFSAAACCLHRASQSPGTGLLLVKANWGMHSWEHLNVLQPTVGIQPAQPDQPTPKHISTLNCGKRGCQVLSTDHLALQIPSCWYALIAQVNIAEVRHTKAVSSNKHTLGRLMCETASLSSLPAHTRAVMSKAGGTTCQRCNFTYVLQLMGNGYARLAVSARFSFLPDAPILPNGFCLLSQACDQLSLRRIV